MKTKSVNVKIKQVKPAEKPRYNFFIIGTFDDELYKDTVNFIGEYLSKKEEYSGITVYITSLGGSIHIAFAIYDLLKSLNTSIYTVALGEFASAATMVFSVGEKRFVGKNTVCLMHTPSIETEDSFDNKRINELHLSIVNYNAIMKDILLNTSGVTKEYKKLINDMFKNTSEFVVNTEKLLEYNVATDLYEGLNSIK